MKPIPIPEVEYPESDGEPLGETQVHFAHTMRLYSVLSRRYRDARALVASNLFCYWEEGNPKAVVCPDLFVALDCPPEPPRRIFRTWEEERVPNFIIELTSLRTKKRDLDDKPDIYVEIGVGEYFLYDPLSDYLDPPLQGHRLQDGEYVRIEPDAAGRLTSEELGLLLKLDDDGVLQLFDGETGARLLSDAEARDAAEAENARLRKLLDERDQGQN